MYSNLVSSIELSTCGLEDHSEPTIGIFTARVVNLLLHSLLYTLTNFVACFIIIYCPYIFRLGNR